jgi:TolA-binding protein
MLIEKANQAYVDSLFDRFVMGVQETLNQATTDSVTKLHTQFDNVRSKISKLRQYVQVELHDIQMSLEQLRNRDLNPDDNEDYGMEDD